MLIAVVSIISALFSFTALAGAFDPCNLGLKSIYGAEEPWDEITLAVLSDPSITDDGIMGIISTIDDANIRDQHILNFLRSRFRGLKPEKITFFIGAITDPGKRAQIEAELLSQGSYSR